MEESIDDSLRLLARPLIVESVTKESVTNCAPCNAVLLSTKAKTNLLLKGESTVEVECTSMVPPSRN